MDCKVFLVLLVNMAIKVHLVLWVLPVLGALRSGRPHSWSDTERG